MINRRRLQKQLSHVLTKLIFISSKGKSFTLKQVKGDSVKSTKTSRSLKPGGRVRGFTFFHQETGETAPMMRRQVNAGAAAVCRTGAFHLHLLWRLLENQRPPAAPNPTSTQDLTAKVSRNLEDEPRTGGEPLHIRCWLLLSEQKVNGKWQIWLFKTFPQSKWAWPQWRLMSS